MSVECEGILNGIVMQRNMRCENVFIILDSRFTLHKLFLFTYHNKQYDFWKWLRINSVPIDVYNYYDKDIILTCKQIEDAPSKILNHRL